MAFAGLVAIWPLLTIYSKYERKLESFRLIDLADRPVPFSEEICCLIWRGFMFFGEIVPSSKKKRSKSLE